MLLCAESLQALPHPGTALVLPISEMGSRVLSGDRAVSPGQRHRVSFSRFPSPHMISSQFPELHHGHSVEWFWGGCGWPGLVLSASTEVAKRNFVSSLSAQAPHTCDDIPDVTKVTQKQLLSDCSLLATPVQILYCESSCSDLKATPGEGPECHCPHFIHEDLEAQ